MEDLDTFRFEPQRQHRWVLEAYGIESFRVMSVSLERKPFYDLVLRVKLLALGNTDLSRNPLDETNKAILKVLDAQGEAIAEYNVVWGGSLFTPFEALNYDSSESITQIVELTHVYFTKRRIE